jgi:hypothetical protein
MQSQIGGGSLAKAKTKCAGLELSVPEAWKWAAGKVSSSAYYFRGVKIVLVDGSGNELPDIDPTHSDADWDSASDVKLRMLCGTLLSAANPYRTAKKHVDTCPKPVCVAAAAADPSKENNSNKASSSSSNKRARFFSGGTGAAGAVVGFDEEDDEAEKQQTLVKFMPNKAQIEKVMLWLSQRAARP